MKKNILVLLIALMVLFFTACSDADADSPQAQSASNTETSSAPAEESMSTAQSVPTESTVHIEFNNREYNEINVIEIPTFVGSSAEIPAMNKAIEDTVGVMMANVQSDGGVDIISYPVTSEYYIQVVTRYMSYPTYGTHGSIVTVNYDKDQDKYITLDDMLAILDLDELDILTVAADQYVPESDGLTISEGEVLGYLIHDAGDDSIIEFFIAFTIDNPDAEPWTYLFSFKPLDENGNVTVLTMLDPNVIVDPSMADVIDPPLLANTLASQYSNSQSEGAALYPVFYGEVRDIYPINYTGQMSAEYLADALTQLTGLDFFITATPVSDGILIDWSTDSTLVAGLDDREQNEDFFFFDATSLGWFMLDSMWMTLTENLGYENVYFSVNGGDFMVNTIEPAFTLPVTEPYMGSIAYL